uniref:RNA-directed DNA polymerase, eukaryota, reverse transcriptase zinc-binding domain protein n=1 Tax=Tanacetum cinerariifolium TaxID=118510 RepID=A0A6L2KEF0_TANCI|nr:RNA-directed DNA polymerase, eukaryota, reverse transcriptase zinc-binding domain protein [Tanacetum cinerariifolium]
MGGLGISSLLANNIGFLGKWKWRFLKEKEALWRMVIKEFYGDSCGFGLLNVGILLMVIGVVNEIADAEAGLLTCSFKHHAYRWLTAILKFITNGTHGFPERLTYVFREAL